MSKNLENIEWKATIDRVTYGSNIIVNTSGMSNADIKEAVGLLALQITASLQRLINGKNDSDIEFDKAHFKYHSSGLKEVKE